MLAAATPEQSAQRVVSLLVNGVAAAIFHVKDKDILMEATWDFVKDDPCYGCRFAV